MTVATVNQKLWDSNLLRAEEAPREWLELENFRFVQEWLAKEERCEKRFGVEFSPPRKILRKSSKILYLDLLKKWIRKKGTSS